jgi:ABC-type transporter Mla subunit MlaD
VTRARRQAHRQAGLGALLVAVIGLAGWLSTVAINGLPWSSPYRVRLDLPADAPLLHAGDDVRIGGEQAGSVASVSLAAGRPGLAVATLELASGYAIGRDATARIRPRGLAGAVYVELRPGQISRPLASGALIRATAGVQVTDVISGFGSDARRAAAQVLTRYGQGLAGRGVALGHSIEASPGLLSNTGTVLRALRPTPGELEHDVAGATATTGALSGPRAVPGLVTAGATVLRTTGLRAPQIRAILGSLPALEQTSRSVLPSADTLLAKLTTASNKLGPGIDALATALPSIVALEQSGSELPGLSHVAGFAARALRALRPALAALEGPASGLTPLSAPIDRLARVLIPYRAELIQAPLGFTRWGNFRYDFGTGAGHRAVRFSMVLTCAFARDAYPRPGAARRERRSCP